MRIIVKFLSLICTICYSITMWAEGGAMYKTIDWNEFNSDTHPPKYGCAYQLSGATYDSIYHVSMEYPELERINETDILRWRLRDENIAEWPDIDCYITTSSKIEILNICFTPIIERGGDYYAIKSCKLVVEASARLASQPLRVQRDAEPDIKSEYYTQNSKLSSGRWIKIAVKESGIYMLTDEMLRSLGFKNPERVLLYGYGGEILPETELKSLPDDLPLQNMWRDKGRYLFYAKGVIGWESNSAGHMTHHTNPYSTEGYYFLTEADSIVDNGLPIERGDSIISNNIIESFTDYRLYEVDGYAWYHSGKRLYDTNSSAIRLITFNTPDMVNGSTLQMWLSYAANGAGELTVSVDGEICGEEIIPDCRDYEEASVVEKQYELHNIPSKNRFTTKLDYKSGIGAEGRLDYLAINYERELRIRDNTLYFRVAKRRERASFRLSNSNRDVMVWRIPRYGQITEIPTKYSEGVTETYSTDIEESDLLVALKHSASYPTPRVVGEVKNQNLHSLKGIDMVIVVPQSAMWISQAERLAELHRQMDGLRVKVLRADEIYNEFSSGTPDATAIRRFLKMLYDRATLGEEPKYLLLFGDGAWDNRMLTEAWRGKSLDNYLLCYESDNSVSHITSYVMEDYFGLLDDNEGYNLTRDRVDIGVGRLPVTTLAQAKAAVDKIENYMRGRYSGTWRNSVMLMADDGDNNIHMRDADNIADAISEINPILLQKKIYWDAYKVETSAVGNSYPAARSDILEALDEGQLLIHYSGHGSADVLSNELVVNKSDMNRLSSPMLPFWVTGSCDIAPFDASLESIGENLILNEKGGAIGLLTTTRTVVSTQNYKMCRLFISHLLQRDSIGRYTTFGDAIRLTKSGLASGEGAYIDFSENKLHFVLLGDPALRLALPELSLVVDSFNGVPSTNSSIIASAGRRVTLVGHLENYKGERVYLNGIVYPKVFDNIRRVTTYNNDKSSLKPFEYSVRDRQLFSGSDSIRQGEFSFSFQVPLDMNYSEGEGMISLYADIDGGLAANGSYTNFSYSSDIMPIVNDSVGPSIALYLNRPDFVYGSDVDATPLFVAEINDPDGINTSGTALGHDMLIVIDNRPEWTYVVNNSFQLSPGDFTQGRVKFKIPKLPDGKHTLMFRVWDNLNNSSTAYLGFNVKSGLKAEIAVSATNNPATDNTTFVIQHDRPAHNVRLTIEVINSNGELQWSKDITDSTNTGVAMLDWNLCSNSGSRVSAGIYLVRAIIYDEWGVKESTTMKLIVL